MKRCILFLIFLLSSNSFFPQPFKIVRSRFNAPSLGKTHFIVGLPHEKINKVSQPACSASTLAELLQCHDGSLKKALFSPDDNIPQTLIQLIHNEQASIKAAVFSFTDGDIAHALVDAHRRGIDVELITDISGTRDKFNKIGILQKYGIKVHIYNPKIVTIFNNIMHNKFVLFGKNVNGKSLLWTGSFNFTKSAGMNNQENVLVLDEMHLIECYEKQFNILKERIYNNTSKRAQRNKYGR